MVRVLVVAFDGLDKELIEDFGLTHIPQTEFGSIDNHTDTNSIYTSELFASFITGKTYHEHGVRGLRRWKYDWLEMLQRTFDDLQRSTQKKSPAEDDRPPSIVQRLTAPFRKSRQFSLSAFKRKYISGDIDGETVFDTVPNSKALFVPSYNPSWFWVVRGGLEPFKYGASVDDVAENWGRDFEYRKDRLFEELENNPALLMCHFHKPDFLQHLYGDRNANFDRAKLQALYEEMDELAAEIIEQSQDMYDYIIFMSDHGLPTDTAHNTNAFYSCNKELFSDKTPHITDFRSKLEEIVGTQETKETDELDI